MTRYPRSDVSRRARRAVACAAAFGIGLVMSVHVTGCTLLGGAIGAVVDASRPPHMTVDIREVARFEPGDTLILQLVDGSEAAGLYAGADRVDRATYETRFEEWRATRPGMPLPALGDPVRVTRRGMIAQLSGPLLGFTWEGVEVARDGGKVETARYVDIGSIQFGVDGGVTGGALRQARTNREPPVSTALALDTAEGRRVIGFDDVVAITGPSAGGATGKGFAIGLALDAVGALTVAMAAHEASRSCGS